MASLRYLIYIRGPDVSDEMLKILLEEEEVSMSPVGIPNFPVLCALEFKF